ncbi:sugar phosphate isomerase/epimerase family protein [Flavitalea antarctica]
MKRSKFLRNLLAVTAISPFVKPGTAFGMMKDNASRDLQHPGIDGHGLTPDVLRLPERGLKTSLNAYSFNDPLSKGSLRPEDLLKFCADHDIDAIDITGYYFKGYPEVPSDDVIFSFKRKALSHGIAISGTGVRNDFTSDDPELRQAHVRTVKAWIGVAAKLGAPVLRIFTGLKYPEAQQRARYLDMVLENIGQCLPEAKAHGVVLAIQNHHDFVRTSEETIAILKAVNSPWLGLVLDIGSYRGPDPFNDIEKSIPYAVNWQIKEKMYINGEEKETDLARLFKIIKSSSYRGYLPIETLGPGDPFKKVPVFLNSVRKALRE